jgi:DNA-binding Lrp family transcriptional regulator
MGLRLRLAELVAFAGAKAILLDTHNDAVGAPVGLRRAVVSGWPFTIQLAVHVLGIDLDDQAKRPAFIRFVALLKRHGIVPVIVASGRFGHRHLFAAVADGAVRSKLARAARRLRLGLRSSMRPPLTLHRRGLPVRLLAPRDPAAAIQALAPPARRELHPRIEDLLRKGDAECRYRTQDGRPDRSAILTAIVTSAIQRGWTRAETYRALMHPRNEGGAKLHDRKRRCGDLAAWHYFKELWKEQVRFCRQRPPLREGRAPHTAYLNAIATVANLSLPWNVRGHSMFATLMACLLIAAEAGTANGWRASYRQIAERAGLSFQTARRALRSLRKLGFLWRLQRGIGTRGSRWRLDLPTTSVTHEHSNPGAEPPGGVLRLLCPGLTLPHDMFRWRAMGRSGLGKGSLRLLALLASAPLTARRLAERTGISVQAAQRAFRRIKASGAVTRGADGKWRPARFDADAVAAVLGVAGAGARQRLGHERERRRYVEWHVLRSARARSRRSHAPGSGGAQ